MRPDAEEPETITPRELAEQSKEHLAGVRPNPTIRAVLCLAEAVSRLLTQAPPEASGEPPEPPENLDAALHLHVSPHSIAHMERGIDGCFLQQDGTLRVVFGITAVACLPDPWRIDLKRWNFVRVIVVHDGKEIASRRIDFVDTGCVPMAWGQAYRHHVDMTLSAVATSSLVPVERGELCVRLQISGELTAAILHADGGPERRRVEHSISETRCVPLRFG